MRGWIEKLLAAIQYLNLPAQKDLASLRIHMNGHRGICSDWNYHVTVIPIG